jgi:hypothetical protein
MPELIETLTDALFRLAQTRAEGAKGRYRSEDLISAAAAFTGEICMRMAADFDFDDHPFTPGQRIFSRKVNSVLSGDLTDWEVVPVTSAFGALRNLLTHSQEIAWPPETFPDIAEIYENFTKITVAWGYVPLSVSSDHAPRMPPLRSAFELRQAVLPSGDEPPVPIDVLFSAGLTSLVTALTVTQSAIDRSVAITLAIETMNGLAKTAPVLPRHMREFTRASA